MRKPETILAGGERVRVLPKRSDPKMPENSTQALAWCRRNSATIVFRAKELEVEVSVRGRIGIGDSFVMAVCDCIYEGMS